MSTELRVSGLKRRTLTIKESEMVETLRRYGNKMSL